MRSGSHVQLAALRNRDLELQTTSLKRQVVMVQFLSINFFCWISSIFVRFFKSSRFFVSPCIMYIRAARHDLLTHVFVCCHSMSFSSRFKTGNIAATINVCVCVWILKFNTWRGFPVDCTSRRYVSILVPKIKFLSCQKYIIFSSVSILVRRRMY